ncbi:MAG: hypothetical protein COA57_08380 [Flavobacteriales bacterium]|nr:SPOR domain-containing protein [Bacteroidales bacterium AH-315-I05]PCJ84925.1 MAG: hypothetical protein COA57_08380 [Flavobacteriales bacterium]
MQIGRYISELLYEHDCVIIPQFGGFVGNYASAKVDRIQNKFSPPSKEISFNKNLTNNDGLLANHISISEDKSFEEANAFVAQQALDLKNRLKAGQKVELEKVGTLYQDAAQNIRFEPDNAVNYSLDAFGFSTLFAHLVVRETVEQKVEKTIRQKISPDISTQLKDRPPIPLDRGKRPLKIMPYLAAAVSLPFVAYIAWLAFNYQLFTTGKFTYANLNPLTEKICVVYKPPLKFKPITIYSPETNLLAAISDTATSVKLSFFERNDPEFSETKQIVVRLKASKPDNTFVARKKPKKAFRFHVIGGCFQYFENAERFVNKLQQQGFEAHIIDIYKGLYRVSVQSYSSRGEMREALASLQSKVNPEAWLLVK